MQSNTYIHALKTCKRHASLFTCSYVSTRVCVYGTALYTCICTCRWVFVLFIYIKVHLSLSNPSFVWINGPLRRALAKNRKPSFRISSQMVATYKTVTQTCDATALLCYSFRVTGDDGSRLPGTAHHHDHRDDQHYDYPA